MWSALAAPCDLARMVTYKVTGTERNGFQVTVTGPSGTNLIGDFSTLPEAEEFADKMRVIDADRSHVGSRHACHDPATPQRQVSASAAYAGGADTGGLG